VLEFQLKDDYIIGHHYDMDYVTLVWHVSRRCGQRSEVQHSLGEEIQMESFRNLEASLNNFKIPASEMVFLLAIYSISI